MTQNIWIWAIVSIQVESPQSIQLLFYDSSLPRWFSNNLPGTELTSTFDYSDMKLFPGSMAFSNTGSNCTMNGYIRELFLYYGITANQYIKDFRNLRLLQHSPDIPFIKYELTATNNNNN